MFNNTFKNKTVVITGHTGFKGSWLSLWLVSLGAKVVGISLDVPTSPSNFEASKILDIVESHVIDVRNIEAVRSIVDKCQPDFCFHMAAQALVRKSYDSPLDTITTNAIGTANVLDALMRVDKKVIAIMITSDKAYDNVEWSWGYREIDRLGGKDPYSASKGMAELAIRSFVSSFLNQEDSNLRVGITRAGNVIGGGDWATDRIVPDCIKAWANGETVDIRNPQSTRPWQHVLEPLSGYISLAVDLSNSRKNHGEAYNFGPSANQNYPVCDLINEMSKYWKKVKWNDVSQIKKYVHEAGLLKLNCDKALFDLNWQPTLDFQETVEMTVEWYRKYYENKNQSMYDFTIHQINQYQEKAQYRNISLGNT